MQNSNPSHNPSSVPTEPSIHPEALARAYERAVQRMRNGDHGTSDLLAAFTARGVEHPDEKARPHGAAAPHAVAQPRDDGARADHGDPEGGTRVTLDELLPVFREPIEWALARAERHVQGDPVDLAALGRVRAAYQSRLAWIGNGGALGEAQPKLRPTDLLTVAGLVVGSIDPSFAQRASIGMRESMLDALAELIPLGQAYAPGAAAPHGAGTFCRCDHIADTPAPFGPPHVPHPVVPVCCCRHGHVL